MILPLSIVFLKIIIALSFPVFLKGTAALKQGREKSFGLHCEYRKTLLPDMKKALQRIKHCKAIYDRINTTFCKPLAQSMCSMQFVRKKRKTAVARRLTSPLLHALRRMELPDFQPLHRLTQVFGDFRNMRIIVIVLYGGDDRLGHLLRSA